MKEDLESIWTSQGINVAFGIVEYSRAEEIQRAVEDGAHDTVLAILPEGSDTRGKNNTHEAIKQRIEVPSQCIQHNHTLPHRLVEVPDDVLWKTETRKIRRIKQTYQLCLDNLLVKHHWFPFAPKDAFNYNVQVGIDVGGEHNSTVMACLG